LTKQNSKKLLIEALVYVVMTIVLGLITDLMLLDNFETPIVLGLQGLLKGSLGIQFFFLITYIGDFYFWIAFAIIYFIYSFSKSRKNFSSAVELVVFLVITTAMTYMIKGAFNRPRPYQHSLDVVPYVIEDSSSYPSGHVSRALGALLILSNRSKVSRYLAYIGVLLLALSRIILGVHYPTDTIGAIFLSLAAWKLSNYMIHLLISHGLIAQ